MTQPVEPLSIIQHLDRCTIRITTDRDKVGTGFFFAEPLPNHSLGENEPFYPLILTNKHVIEGAKEINLVVTCITSTGSVEHQKKTVPLSSMQPVFHPGGIDLVALNISAIVESFIKQNIAPRLTYLDKSIIPSPVMLREFAALSDIVMVGYPNGIWDTVNNRPIFRRGITATDPAEHWCGNHEFLMDIAVFGGSSGSPVFLYNNGAYSTNKGINFGSRLQLIGINRAVYEQAKDGVLRVIETPTEQSVVPTVGLPMNLGVCISSQELLPLLAEITKPRPMPPLGDYNIPPPLGGYNISIGSA